MRALLAEAAVASVAASCVAPEDPAMVAAAASTSTSVAAEDGCCALATLLRLCR